MTDNMPDDMGDDQQQEEVALTEKYVEDPPDDLVIEGDDEGGTLGIYEYEREESRRGSDPWPPEDDSSIHTTTEP